MYKLSLVCVFLGRDWILKCYEDEWSFLQAYWWALSNEYYQMNTIK
jgi:hypothetical protein